MSNKLLGQFAFVLVLELAEVGELVPGVAIEAIGQFVEVAADELRVFLGELAEFVFDDGDGGLRLGAFLRVP